MSFGQGNGSQPPRVYVCIRSHLPPMAQEGEEMVRGPGFELGTPIFSAGCLKWRRGHKSLRHNVGSSTHSCKSFTALHRVARGNVYGIRIGEGHSDELAPEADAKSSRLTLHLFRLAVELLDAWPSTPLLSINRRRLFHARHWLRRHRLGCDTRATYSASAGCPG